MNPKTADQYQMVGMFKRQINAPKGIGERSSKQNLKFDSEDYNTYYKYAAKIGG